MEIKIKNIDEFAKQFLIAIKIEMARVGRGFEDDSADLLIGEFVKNLKSNSKCPTRGKEIQK